VSGTPQELLRTTFEQVPELYDRARPNYPPEIFDDLVALAQLPTKARLLEIGCGTGQATLPLVERGYEITCVELGEQLAAVARRKLATFSTVEVINANFESWRPERAEFDAIVAFTAFHWISAETRYTKTAELLRERGRLAIVATQHVLPLDGDPFFVDVQQDYEAVVPDDPSTKAGAGGPPRPDAVADLSNEIALSGRFRNVGARRYLWDMTYTADDYIAALNTYSGHRALDDETRERLLARIHRRIETRPDGRVRKTYLAMLNVAERVSTRGV
jgi:protein-L-isoaspartate O-methyltransferase